MTAPAETRRQDAAAATGLRARIVAYRPPFTLDVSLQVPAGQVVALMGPSGAGKSTLLGVLAGLAPFDGGEVHLGGRVLDAAPGRRTPPAARGVVLLGQDPRLFPHLSAFDNIAFGLRVRGASKQAAAAGAVEWLERVGLGDLGYHRPAQLSGGQQQRVALARALATEPSVLLLDEPLASLDLETAGDIRALLHRQLTTATTAIVATHDAVDAAALASTLVVLEGGRVTQSGPVREVLAHPATRFAAAVAGLNRVDGAVTAGTWRAGGLTLAFPTPHDSEPRAEDAAQPPASVAAVFRPGDVRVFAEHPRNSQQRPGEWAARVVRLEQTPAGVRVRTADPDIAADVPAEQAAGLAAGDTVALCIDPAHVRFTGAGVGA